MKRKYYKKVIMSMMFLVCSNFLAACSADSSVGTGETIERTGEESASIQNAVVSSDAIEGTDESTSRTENTEEVSGAYPDELRFPEGTKIGEYFAEGGRGNSDGWYIETDRSKWENPYPEVTNIPAIYQADGWIELHEQEEVLLNNEGAPYVPTNHMEIIKCEELEKNRLWLMQAEVELYTNTEVETYGISEQDNIVHYWCVAYSDEKISFLFLKQDDFSESEIRDIIYNSYSAVK